MGDIEIVRAALEAWNRRDMEAVARDLAPDFEWIEHDQNPVDLGAGQLGVGAIEEVTSDIEGSFADYRAEILELSQAGEGRVLAVMRESGKGAASGAPIVTEFGYLITISDGKLTRVQAYRTPEEARAAARSPG